MGKNLVISDGQITHDAVALKVAIGGVVKPVQFGRISNGGVVKEFWPPDAGIDPPDNRIVWTTNYISINQVSTDPDDSFAVLRFTRSSGLYDYNNYPDANVRGAYLLPALDGTPADDGKYLLMLKQISGDPIDGPAESWIDLNADPSILFYLDRRTPGISTAAADVSIAQDDGTGNPVLSTIVTKYADFRSQVLPNDGGGGEENDIGWSDVQRDLVEFKEGVDADCSVTFNPNGNSVGSADTSGAFTEAWLKPAGDPTGMTVRCDVVSGVTPSGNTVGLDHTLDEVRRWTLLAGSGEDFSNELDITVEDGVFTSTKRVTMHSRRTEAANPPVWNTDPWTLSDAAFRQELALLVEYTLNFNTGGNATGSVSNSNGGGTQESDPWLPAGDNPADYEVRLINTSGAAGLISHTDGVWYRLSTSQVFIIEYATIAGSRTRTYSASLRKVGGPTISKTINLFTARALDDGSQPP